MWCHIFSVQLQWYLPAELFSQLSKVSAVNVTFWCQPLRIKEGKKSLLDKLFCTGVQQSCREKSIAEMAEEERPISHPTQATTGMITIMIKDVLQCLQSTL